MPLLMLDLDGTLIDRDAAFGRALGEFTRTYALGDAALEFAIAGDRGGYRPRRELLETLHAQWGDRVPVQALVDLLNGGGAAHVRLEPGVRAALLRARAAGWTLTVVTNGPTAQQRRKLEVAGIDALVDGWAISEEVGVAKPERGIFEAAARSAGQPLAGSWMIGDSAPADIGGAVAVGARSCWLSYDRPWPDDLPFRPTVTARDIGAALHAVLGRTPDHPA